MRPALALAVVSLSLTGCPESEAPPAGGAPPATAPASPAGDPAAALARQVAAAAGAEAWGRVGVLRFTFAFPAKQVRRSYAWDVPAGTVSVTHGETTVEVPVAGFPPGANPTPEQAQGHKTFVNDSFWAFPCGHLVGDSGTTLEDLGEVGVPGLPALGQRRALSLGYDPQAGGYTPGDRYVFYLGDDRYPVAWAFHRQGAPEPTFVAEWREPRDVAGLRVVSRYFAAGAIDLQITDVTVEPREAAEEAAPTSRPAGG